MSDSLRFIQSIRASMDLVTHQAFREHGRYVKSTGLSMPQFGILMHLKYHQLCSLSDISARMGVTAAASSQLVDKLVQGGLLERAEDPVDRRAKQITLSARGHELVEAGLATRHDWVDVLVKELTPAECELVEKGLAVLARALRKKQGEERPDGPVGQTRP